MTNPITYPTLHVGQSNKAVRSLQNSLRRALVKRGIVATNKANGIYGVETTNDVNRFKHAYDIRPVQGLDFGGDGEWLALIPFIGPYDQAFIDGYAKKVAADKAAEQAALDAIHGVGMQAQLASIALRFYAEREYHVYRQVRPMVGGLFDVSNRNRLDCSSTVTLIYKEAKAPDPNGRDYDGQGYTGTLWPRGTFLTGAKPMAGDLSFYGWQDGGIPSHVAICISDTEVVSFGHTPIERYPIRYRSDFRGIKRYL